MAKQAKCFYYRIELLKHRNKKKGILKNMMINNLTMTLQFIDVPNMVKKEIWKLQSKILGRLNMDDKPRMRSRFSFITVLVGPIRNKIPIQLHDD
jgi:hypothetical protein